MSNLYLQLLKIPVNHAAIDTARAYIALKGSSIEKVGKEAFTTISAECRTLQEVEEASEWLIKELKAIKRQAATFFEKEKKNRRDIANKS
jgi:DNA-directed RNA polymerase subunit L